VPLCVVKWLIIYTNWFSWKCIIYFIFFLSGFCFRCALLFLCHFYLPTLAISFVDSLASSGLLSSLWPNRMSHPPTTAHLLLLCLPNRTPPTAHRPLIRFSETMCVIFHLCVQPPSPICQLVETKTKPNPRHIYDLSQLLCWIVAHVVFFFLYFTLLHIHVHSHPRFPAHFFSLPVSQGIIFFFAFASSSNSFVL